RGVRRGTTAGPGTGWSFSDVGRYLYSVDGVSAEDCDRAAVHVGGHADHFTEKRNDNRGIYDIANEGTEELHGEFVHFAVPIKGRYERTGKQTREGIQPAGDDGLAGTGSDRAGGGGADLHTGRAGDVGDDAARGIAGRFPGRVEYVDEGSGAGGGRLKPRYGDRVAVGDESGVWLRADGSHSGTVLSRQRQYCGSEFSDAEWGGISVRAAAGI